MRLSKNQTLCFGLMLLIGFGLRLWLLIAEHKRLTNTLYDDRFYVSSARVLVLHHIFTYSSPHLPTVFLPPGFPFYLACIFLILGVGTVGMYAALVGNALMGTVILALMVRLGVRLGQANAGLVAAWLFALYPPALVLSDVYLTETLFTLLLVWLFVRLLHAVRTGRLRHFFLAGFVLGLATLTRPTIALLQLVVGVYLWGRSDYRFRRAFRAGITMVAALLLTLSPWIVRNYIDFHQFIPLTQASGNPFLTGTYNNNNIYMYGTDPQFQGWPKGWSYVPGDELATNNRLMQLGLARLKQEFHDNPSATIQWYTIGKFNTFWSRPFDWNGVLKPLFGAITLWHRLLLGLSLLGFLLALWRRLPCTWLFLLFFAYFTGLHMVFTTLPRYAFPLLPFVFFYSGFLLTGARRSVRTESTRRPSPNQSLAQDADQPDHTDA